MYFYAPIDVNNYIEIERLLEFKVFELRPPSYSEP